MCLSLLYVRDGNYIFEDSVTDVLLSGSSSSHSACLVCCRVGSESYFVRQFIDLYGYDPEYIGL